MILNEDFVPSTIDEAIHTIICGLENKDIEFILDKSNSPIKIHDTIGRKIRNEWSMWDNDTPLKQDFQRRFGLFGHADDISHLVFMGVWACVHEEENIEKVCTASSAGNHAFGDGSSNCSATNSFSPSLKKESNGKLTYILKR